MARASMVSSRSQFCPSNFRRNGVIRFKLDQSPAHPRDVRTIIRALQSSQKCCAVFSIFTVPNMNVDSFRVRSEMWPDRIGYDQIADSFLLNARRCGDYTGELISSENPSA